MGIFVCNSVPEWSSLTSEDTVFVMESAATRRSFLKFLLGPGEDETIITLSGVAHHMLILVLISVTLTQCGTKLECLLK